MRLLLVADLHYSLPQFDWVLDIASDFDVVVMAGDHLDLASLVDGRAQSIVVRKYFDRLRAKTKLVGLLRQSRSRYQEPARREDRQMAVRTAARGSAGRRGVLAPRRHVDHGLPMVGRSNRQGRHRQHSWPKPRRSAASAGSGSITRRPPSRRRVGAATDISATWNFSNGSSNTGPTWSSPAMCISRPSSRTALGSIASGRPGCSTPGSNSVRRRRISSSTPMPTRRCGSLRAGNQFVRLGAPLERPVPKLQALPDWLKAEDRPRAQGPG